MLGLTVCRRESLCGQTCSLSLVGAGSWVLCLHFSGDQPRLMGSASWVWPQSSRLPIRLAIAFRLQASVFIMLLEFSWETDLLKLTSLGVRQDGQVIRMKARWKGA